MKLQLRNWARSKYYRFKRRKLKPFETKVCLVCPHLIYPGQMVNEGKIGSLLHAGFFTDADGCVQFHDTTAIGNGVWNGLFVERFESTAEEVYRTGKSVFRQY